MSESPWTQISLEDIETNPNNPRKFFDQESLEQLAQSIREVGILQPLVVVPVRDKEGNLTPRYRLICGERRYRAAKLAGRVAVPVSVKHMTPVQEAEIMLIENLQRKDLGPVEEARAYQELLSQHDYTQEALGEKLGVSQAHIANRIRLLELPDTVKENISRGIISASHGKVMAGHKNVPAEILEEATKAITENNVPVARTSDTVRRLVAEKGMPLYDHWHYDKKPQFKTGKGSSCYECEHRAIGIYAQEEQPYCMSKECWDAKQAEAIEKQVKKAEKADTVDISKLNYTQYEYWSEGSSEYDQSECRDCIKRKRGEGRESYFCLDPACMKKKKAAMSKQKNKAARDAFQEELQKISELADSHVYYRYPVSQELTVTLDRQALMYLAAQILGSVDQMGDRKVTVYKYLKDNYGLEHDVLKRGAYGMLNNEWEIFRSLLATLDERQLLSVIFEWPAVARGLQGAEGWFLHQVLDYMPQREPAPAGEQEQEAETTAAESVQDPVKALMGRSIRTHYNTGGVVINVIGPRGDGSYTINYKGPNDKGKHFSILNDISVKDGVVFLRDGIPLTILDEPDPGPGEDIQPESPWKRYLDKQGHELFVSNCGFGNDFSTVWRYPGGDFNRVINPDMPIMDTLEEAQQNLDIYALKNGLKQVLPPGDNQAPPEDSQPEEEESEPDKSAEPAEPRRYLDDRGRDLFVASTGDEYGTFWKTPLLGGMHRVKSPAMPMVKTREEAQANLDAYAEKKGFKLVTEEPSENVLAALEVDDADPAWKEALEGLTDEELQQVIKREARPSAKSKLRAEARRRAKESGAA